MTSYTVQCPCCNNEFDFYRKAEANQKEAQIRREIKRLIKRAADLKRARQKSKRLSSPAVSIR